MISAAFISKRTIFILLAAFIVSIFLYTRLHNFENRYSFDHDAEQTANAAWKIIVEKKPILIGQETSVGGLFVGPFLWWIQTAAMYLGHLNPISLGYLGVVASFATLIMFFLVTSEISNRWQALLASFLYVISTRLIIFDLSGIALTYIMLYTLIFLWLSIKIFVQNKIHFFPVLAFLTSIAFHIHFSLLLLIPIIAVLIILQKPAIPKKYLFHSAILFLFPLFTFVLFDLRHDFLITNKLINFASTQNETSSFRIFQTTSTQFSFLIESIFFKTKYFVLFFFLLIGYFIYLMRKQGREKLLYLLLLLLFLPLALLWFYKGSIPEYYFLPTVPIFMIIAGFVYSDIFKKSRLLFAVVLGLSIFYNLNNFKEIRENSQSFNIKLKIVDSVISDSGPDSFNIYYQMPPGIDKGYRYLFKWRGHAPQEDGKNLYILEFINPNEFQIEKYLKTYPQKKVLVQPIGFVHIVSVK